MNDHVREQRLLTEGEPQSSPASDDSDGAAGRSRAGHRPFAATAYVAVSALYPALRRWRCCGAAAQGVRSLRPAAPRPTRAGPPRLIVDLQDERELDEALRAACLRAGKRGRRWRLEGAACAGAGALPRARSALAAGLDIVSFDHVARRPGVGAGTASRRGGLDVEPGAPGARCRWHLRRSFASTSSRCAVTDDAPHLVSEYRHGDRLSC